MGNSKGQSILETLLILPVMMAAFLGVLSLIYWGVIYFYSHYRMEEALLCAASSRSPQTCELEMQRSLKPLLLFQEDCRAHLQKSSSRAQISVSIDFRNLHQKMNLDSYLHLPLEDNIQWETAKASSRF